MAVDAAFDEAAGDRSWTTPSDRLEHKAESFESQLADFGPVAACTDQTRFGSSDSS